MIALLFYALKNIILCPRHTFYRYVNILTSIIICLSCIFSLAAAPALPPSSLPVLEPTPPSLEEKESLIDGIKHFFNRPNDDELKRPPSVVTPLIDDGSVTGTDTSTESFLDLGGSTLPTAETESPNDAHELPPSHTPMVEVPSLDKSPELTMPPENVSLPTQTPGDVSSPAPPVPIPSIESTNTSPQPATEGTVTTPSKPEVILPDTSPPPAPVPEPDNGYVPLPAPPTTPRIESADISPPSSAAEPVPTPSEPGVTRPEVIPTQTPIAPLPDQPLEPVQVLPSLPTQSTNATVPVTNADAPVANTPVSAEAIEKIASEGSNNEPHPEPAPINPPITHVTDIPKPEIVESKENKNAADTGENVQKNEVIVEYSPEALQFAKNETQVLLLPDDELVLGVLTPKATLDQMDIYEYIAVVKAEENRFLRKNCRKLVDSFIAYHNDIDDHLQKQYYYCAIPYAFRAVQNNNLLALRILLCTYPILQERNARGDTLLHATAHNNNYYLTKFLLLRGVQLSLLNNDCQTALDIAREAQYNSISCLLVKAAMSK